MTPLNKLSIADVVDSDKHQTIYEAYDQIKKCWCYVTIPNVKTSWDYSVTY